jgi:hypothetical protein
MILLLVAFAICTLYILAKRKYDTNLPLAFYAALIVFINVTGQELDPYLFSSGLLAALMLRFEFMNRAITRLIWAVEMAAVAGIALQFLKEVFSLRLPNF